MTAAGVRSVVLLGPAGAGKSTLAGALLAAAGAPAAAAPGPGRMAYGALTHRGTRVGLLDPPGALDLVGEVHAAIRGASAALFVVSPVAGVDPRTAQLWEVCEAAGLPRLVVLSQLDRPGADADEAVAVCQRVLGDTVLPLQVPLHDDGPVGGLLDLLTLAVSDGAGTARRAADPEHVRLVEGLRADLLEAVLTGSEDEEVFERWLAGDEPSPEVLGSELAAAVARGDVQPALVAVPLRGVGLADLLDLLVRALPDARARPAPAATSPDGSPVAALEPDPGGPLVAEAVRVGLLRVWSGTLRPGAPVVVGGPRPLPAGPPVPYLGPAAGPGELVPTGLDVLPGQVVCEPGGLRLLDGWSGPPAGFPVGVQEDLALVRRVAQDPVARLEVARTGQLLLWSTGPGHAELLLDGRPAAPVAVPPGARRLGARVHVPDWCAGTVRSDLAGRGGQVLDSGQDENGTWIEARLPPAELGRYAPALARLTAGTGALVWAV